jgi:predicted MPP superfamily phosphohydrolase
VVALAGVVDSLAVREEEVNLVLDGAAVEGLQRAARGSARSPRPLRIVQITDPHLGPFMSVSRLRTICERAVEQKPDLVLLTGDFLTMESQSDERHLAEALSQLRIAMLHDPGGFRHVPEGAADLVLSGHTHGGQLGLLWLGLQGTIVSVLTSLPDHGFWALGKNRLYVHRGTGHYGFPLRVGVPAEQSLLAVHAIIAPLATNP